MAEKDASPGVCETKVLFPLSYVIPSQLWENADWNAAEYVKIFFLQISWIFSIPLCPLRPLLCEL